MRGMDLATMAAGATDGSADQKAATQRDRMREMLGNKGVLPPEPEPETSAAPTTDLGAIAADEQEEMEGYHGLTIDDASGNKMFYTGNTLSERKRREKRQQFRKVFFYVELARHGQTIGADVERELSARQSRIAHMIYNSRRYAGWLVLVYMVQMALSFWEPAYFGQSEEEGAPAAPAARAVLDFACIAAYGVDGLMQIFVAGWKDFSTRTVNRLYFLLVGSMFVDLFMSIGFSRFSRPLLVMVRHARVRAELGLMWRSLGEVVTPFFMLLATLGLGAIFSVVLLRYEYGGEITPGLGTGVASASSVGGFTNIHRAFLTLVSLVTTSDTYQFVYLARDYPALKLGRIFASLWMAVLLGCCMVSAMNGAFALLGAYQTALEKQEATKRSRQRRFLALSFKTLDDRKNSYVAIEKLRYLLATVYPAIPFEPVAKMLKRNVDEQSGLVDFFDYLTVMDFVLNYTPPDPALLYGTNTHMWHTLPLCVTIANAAVLCLFGTVSDDKALDSANAFFTFLYGVEIGAKMFALRPGRFFRSASNKIDFVLVVGAVLAQILTVVIIFEAKSFWRSWASLPLLRLFHLNPPLRKTVRECRVAVLTLVPGFAVPALLFYLGAIGGMQLFHGKVHTESGYPGQFNSFDDFGSALLTLWCVCLGSWSRTLLGPAGGAGPHGQVDWNVGDAPYGLVDGMEHHKPGPDIAGGPLAAGQHDAAAAFTSMAASWYLLFWRLLTVSTFAATLVRTAAARSAAAAVQRKADEAAAAASAALGEPAEYGMPKGAVAAQGLPALKTDAEREHVSTLLAGVQRLHAELAVMDHAPPGPDHGGKGGAYRADGEGAQPPGTLMLEGP